MNLITLLSLKMKIFIAHKRICLKSFGRRLRRENNEHSHSKNLEVNSRFFASLPCEASLKLRAYPHRQALQVIIPQAK